MPVFNYKGRDNLGNVSIGTVEANSQDEALLSLQRRGCLVISITEIGIQEKRPIFSSKVALRHFHRKAKLDDLLLFCKELAALLESGVTLVRSLDIISKQLESRVLFDAVEAIKKDIEGGHSLKDALSKHPKLFPGLWVHLVGTGEASGTLSTSFKQLAQYLEASSGMRRKILSALIYPCILTIVSIFAILIFVLKIVPVFADIFKSFNLELPLLTKAIIAASGILLKNFFLILIGLGACIFVFNRFLHTERGKMEFDKLKLNLPVLGETIRQVAIARFATSLSTLLKGGVPILYSLEIVEGIAGNKLIENAVHNLREEVRKGRNMAGPMESSGVFPPMVVQMVSIGEEIGELANMLEKIAAFFEERITASLARLTSLFEPFILVVMGGIVGILVFSVFLPIFKLTTLGGG